MRRLKKMIKIEYCGLCKKKTAHHYWRTNKTKKLPSLVYYGCACGWFISLIGYIDESRNMIKFKDENERNDKMYEWHINYKRNRHLNPKKYQPRLYNSVKNKIKSFEEKE